MQRLRGSDAFAIYSETPTSPFVTLKVAIYRPVDKNDVPDISELRRFVKSRLVTDGLESMGMRIMRVPFDLHHPVWVADPDFSPDDHICRVALPSPGGKAELCDFLSELLGKPLDPGRPLWEFWLVEGLEDGRTAVVLKLHHALADGKTAASVIARSDSNTAAPELKTADVAGEPIPGKARLILGALVDLIKSYTVELPHYYRHLQQARRGSAALRAAGDDGAKPFTAPYTILNREGGRYRTYRYETFSLVEFKALSKIFDCTVNTLILGVCSEALRRYLLEVDTVPSASLISAMPVGDQGGGDVETLLHSKIHNNNLAVAIVPLHQNIADFGQRLQAIKRSSRAAIDSVRRSNGRRFDNYLDYLPGTFIRLMHQMMNSSRWNKKYRYANVVISNVPGPREAVYAVDGRLEMVELLSSGNLVDGGCLNITVWSYVDKLCFSFYSRKGALPEPDKINGHLREVVAELRGQYLAEKAPLEAG
jgi:diacylglycerol O-acyltransferase / wax synthase